MQPSQHNSLLMQSTPMKTTQRTCCLARTQRSLWLLLIRPQVRSLCELDTAGAVTTHVWLSRTAWCASQRENASPLIIPSLMPPACDIAQSSALYVGAAELAAARRPACWFSNSSSSVQGPAGSQS